MREEQFGLIEDGIYASMLEMGLEGRIKGLEGLGKVDAVADILRDALSRYSMGMFNGVPYFYGGKIYERMKWSDLDNIVYDVMKRCKVPYGFYMKATQIAKMCRSVIESKTLNPDSSLMVFDNCVYNTDNGEIYDFSPNLVQVTKAGYSYYKGDVPFMWNQFLNEVLPDEELRNVLQEFLGSVFIDRRKVKIETMVILYGSGSNGKSVIFETITGILGKENISNYPLSALIGGSEKKADIAHINGKRLNYCSEMQTLSFGKNSDALKSLISGEPQEARVPYGQPFTAYNIPLLMANANMLPRLTDSSWGMRRRLCIIPFTVKIPTESQNKTLSEDLRAEYSGIFNWMIEGKQRFVENRYKYTHSAIIERTSDEYAYSANSVLLFMFSCNYLRLSDDVLDIEPTWVNFGDLYGEYRMFCRRRGMSIEDEKTFWKVIDGNGYDIRKKEKGWCVGIYGTSVMERYKYAKPSKAEENKRERDLGRDRDISKKLEVTAMGASGDIEKSLEGVELRRQEDGGEIKKEKYRYKKKYKERFKKRNLMRDPKVGTMKLIDGRKYVKGQNGLAKLLGYSVSYVEKLMREKTLEGLYVKEGRRYYFDALECVKKVNGLEDKGGSMMYRRQLDNIDATKGGSKRERLNRTFYIKDIQKDGEKSVRETV